MEANQSTQPTKPKQSAKKWDDMSRSEKATGLIGLAVVALIAIWIISAIIGAEVSETVFIQAANTPEDVACKLSIELFKQNILTRETN